MKTRLSGSKPVGIKAVAQLAGVSTATVSRVLNNSPIPSEATRSAVLQAANQLNYQPDPVLSEAIRRRRRGQMAKPARGGVIGFLVSQEMYSSVASHDGHWYGQIMPGMQKALAVTGHQLLLESHNPEQDQLPTCVMEGRADGLLAWCNLSRAMAVHLTRRLPVVFADRIHHGLRADCVLNHHEHSVHMQLEYLWGLGHRHIAVLDHEAHSVAQALRRRGMEAFFNDHSLAPSIAKLNRPWPLTPQTNEQVIADFVRELVATRPRPTAILMGQCGVGQHVIRQLRQHGLGVPQDISIVTAQDHIHDTYCDPPLTSFSFPAHDIGQAAAELLLARIASPDRPRRELYILGRRIDRPSVAPPASAPGSTPGSAS